MSAELFLKCLGYPELRRADGTAIKLKVRKHLALLVYLAVDSRRSHRRDALADLLWTGVPTPNSRHSLSMGLSVLRSILGPQAFTTTTATVRFQRECVLLDLDLLQRGEVLGNETRPPLAVDGFLMDFEIADAPGFHHWRERHHAQLLPSVQAGLLTLIDHARRSGDMTGVMEFAERLLQIDSLAEEGVRTKMEAFAMKGDRVNALRTFEEYRSELSTQLGAEPSELLEGIATRLRRRGVDHPPGTVRPFAQTERWADRPFVGREAEYRVLFEAWESTTQLNTRHVLLTGETGIGKSTLAMRFGAAAALEGAAVARVQCFELEQRIAFGMIGALVTSLLDKAGVVATAPESLAEVARVIPRVRERFPSLPRPRQTEGEAARLHFAEGTFALFDSIIEEQPLVLIVDDYPRSDEASLSVLHMMLRRASTERLMVVLSGRPPEPGEPAQATRIRKGVSYLPMQHLAITPLTEEQSAELIDAILENSSKKPGSAVRRAILRAGSGNPMALELLSQDWMLHGDAAVAISLPAMQSQMPSSALEAAAYDRLIEQMLPDLTPRTRLTLYLAAILGPRLNDLNLFGIVGLTSTQAMTAMAELSGRRMLRDGGPELEFTNELIRARLYLRIPSAMRTRLHKGVATRLLAAAATGQPLPGLEIAWHCIRARRNDEATPFLMRGAHEAITHGAPDEAARALSSALPHLRGLVKLQAAVLLAETYQEMAEWKAALECIADITDLLGNDCYTKEMAELLAIESRRQLGYYEPGELPELLKLLVAKVASNSDLRTRARAASEAVGVAGRLNSPEHLTDARHAILTIPIDQLSVLDRGRVLLARALSHYHFRENGESLNHVLEASRLLSEIGATDTTFVDLNIGLGAIACANGAYADGLVPLGIAYQAALKLDNAQLMAMASSNLSLCHHRLGASVEQLKWATIAWNQVQGGPEQSYDRILAASRCAFAYEALGEKGRAVEFLRHLRCIRQHPQHAWMSQIGLAFEADLVWLLGDRKLALGLVSEMLNLPKEIASRGAVGHLARWTTLYSIKMGRPADACRPLHEWYDQLDRLDALDRAEVLCSIFHLGSHVDSSGFDVASEARVALAHLPIACSHQLQQLGLRLPC
jgi:DNA-binding SARP family transcriptional activator